MQIPTYIISTKKFALWIQDKISSKCIDYIYIYLNIYVFLYRLEKEYNVRDALLRVVVAEDMGISCKILQLHRSPPLYSL